MVVYAPNDAGIVVGGGIDSGSLMHDIPRGSLGHGTYILHAKTGKAWKVEISVVEADVAELDLPTRQRAERYRLKWASS